jgi:hypothetical protein
VDTANGDQNPYGLAIAPISAGSVVAGDLLVCNFNNGSELDGGGNIQGQGTTIEVLAPTPGSSPTRLVQDSTNLLGCNALTTDPSGNIWAAALVGDENPLYSPSGSLVATPAGPWSGPWGEAYANTPGATWSASVAVSDQTGSIYRIDISDAGMTFDTIATGFSVNGGVAGTVLAPSGLTYDQVTDTLYIVDSNVNRVVSLSGFSTLPAGGIQVEADGGFTGSSAASASVLFAGAPLNAPISSAQLFNGDLVVGNTADNNLIEISLAGQVVGTQTLDNGAAGALFGIAAQGDSAQTLQIFFNDDNDNTVKVLAP